MEEKVPLRADIQILRGVAVLAVMMAHFGALLPGGFLGVDIFFAISGFVITLSFVSLHGKASSTTALLTTFWKRRFWRLFPALTLVLFVTLASALLLLPADDYRDQWELTIWSFFFAGNIGVEMVSQQDYFDPAAKYNWLLHLWSLGVEEQFYLIFPFLMIFLLSQKARFGRLNLLLLWVGVASLISFGAASADDLAISVFGKAELLEVTGVSAALGYYSPITRAWQFAVGIFAAFLAQWRPLPKPHRIAPLTGLAILGASLILMPASNLLPGPLTLVPMAAMFLLLRYRMPSSFSDAAWLGPLRWLGDRSYSAYLWHWPVWSVFTMTNSSLSVSILGSFAVTLALCATTYRLVEQPIIQRYRSREGQLPSPTGEYLKPARLLALFLISPLILGVAVQTTENVFRSTGKIGQRAEVPRIDPALDCIQTNCAGLDIEILLIGDSHAGALAGALSEELGDRGIQMRGAIVPGCLHLPSVEIASLDAECREFSNQVRDIIASTSPKWVVIYGYTAGRFTTMNSGRKQEIEVFDSRTGTPVTSQTAVSAYQTALEETLRFIAKNSDASVAVISGTPDFRFRPEDVGPNPRETTLAEVLWSPWMGGRAGQEVSREEWSLRHGPFFDVEQLVEREFGGVVLVDSWSALCEADKCSQFDKAGELLFSDQDHISQRGARILALEVAALVMG